VRDADLHRRREFLRVRAQNPVAGVVIGMNRHFPQETFIMRTALFLAAIGVAGCSLPSSIPFFGKKKARTGAKAPAGVDPTGANAVALAATGAAKQLARVTTDDAADETTPRLSDDGKQLLYVASLGEPGDFSWRRIVKAKPDGKNAVILTDEDGQAYAPAWLPGAGSYLAVSHAMGSVDIVKALRLTPRSPSTRVLSEREAPGLTSLAIAPGGDRIAFANDVAGTTTIGIAKLDGKDLTYLTPGDQPAWSPDGRQLVFERLIAGYRQLLLTDAATGEEMTQLTEGKANAWGASFSPDGRYVAYVSDAGSPGSPHVYAMRTDGTGMVQLTRGYAAATTPHWGSDGWIYFAADQGGTDDVWRVMPDAAALAAGR
jgi:TolB protein